MIVDKPDGGHTLVVNYSKLYSQSEYQALPIPRIDDLIARVGQARYLTKLDITKAYWNVKFDEKSIQYSAFVTFD